MKRKTIQHNGKDLEVIIPDVEWMRKKYVEFLPFFSDGFMPPYPPQLRINNRLQHCWGKAAYWKSVHGDSGPANSWESEKPVPKQYIHKEVAFPIWKWNGTYPRENCPRTRIDLRATKWLPEYLYENTLIHEMCHIYCYLNGLWAGHQGHDGWFLMVAEKIKTASGGKYEILARVSDEASTLCREINDPPGIVVGLKLNGTVPYAFRSPRITRATNTITSRFNSQKETNGLFLWFSDEHEARTFVVKAFSDPTAVFGNRKPVVYGDSGPDYAKFVLATFMKADAAEIEDPRKKGWPGWIKKRAIAVEGGTVEPITNQKLFGSYKIKAAMPQLSKAGAAKSMYWVKNTLAESVNGEDSKNLETIFEGVLMNAVRSFWEMLKKDIAEVKRSLLSGGVMETEDGWEVI